MKKLIFGTILLSTLSTHASDEIKISKKINSKLSNKIEKDLEALDNFHFRSETNPELLKILGVSNLNNQTARDWLGNRVNYIIEEKAFNLFNLLVKKVVYTADKNVQYPNANIVPYSISEESKQSAQSIFDSNDGGFTVMSNIGAGLYYSGKTQNVVYGMKISNGFLRATTKVQVNSPRVGIIQIGEGLFAPELAIDKNNPDAIANTIFRLGTFFHEARHSDGNGKSLGFFHATCPKGHDYEGAPACDDNLNGPYTIGYLMLNEMNKSCDDSSCSPMDKEMLKMFVIDSASRILNTTSKGEPATYWDDTPESI